MFINPQKVQEVFNFYGNFKEGDTIPQDIDLAVACLAQYYLLSPSRRSNPAQPELILKYVASDKVTIFLTMLMPRSDNPYIQLALNVLEKVKSDAFSAIDVDVFSKYM